MSTWVKDVFCEKVGENVDGIRVKLNVMKLPENKGIYQKGESGV